jgi:hypothetical protein
VILPHNLKIVDYSIAIPGSIHDASAFQRTRTARHPEQFFNNGEWLWADSAYSSQTWCVTPFKRPVGGNLTQEKRFFNNHLSSVRFLFISIYFHLFQTIKVRVRSEHFYGSLKGRFQSLRELRIQIQGKDDLDYAAMWIWCCLILHNMIIEIEEELGLQSSQVYFAQQYREANRDIDDEENDEGEVDDGLAYSTGQNFRQQVMDSLLQHFQ